MFLFEILMRSRSQELQLGSVFMNIIKKTQVDMLFFNSIDSIQLIRVFMISFRIRTIDFVTGLARCLLVVSDSAIYNYLEGVRVRVRVSLNHIYRTRKEEEILFEYSLFSSHLSMKHNSHR